MTRQTVLIAIAIFAVLVGLAAILLRPQGPEETVSETVGTETEVIDEDAAVGETQTMEVFFPGVGSWLVAESREVPASGELAERIVALMERLLAGPEGIGGRSPLPEDAGVRRVYLAANGLAFVDFESPQDVPPASGSSQEMLTVYSLVNTVLLNFKELDAVVLLWNGRQLKTFAGHVDTMRPLAAKPELIARETGRDSSAIP